MPPILAVICRRLLQSCQPYLFSRLAYVTLTPKELKFAMKGERQSVLDFRQGFIPKYESETELL